MTTVPAQAPTTELSTSTTPGDLPLTAALALPVIIVAAFIASVLASPDSITWWIAPEEGVFETPGVYVLVPGILAGFALFIRNPPLPAFWLRWWVLAWTLACVYFLGEEISWGQHMLGWETPEALEEINKQDETNLHNTTSWLNQKPRTAVELFFLVGGLVIPLIHRFVRPTGPTNRDYWFWPTLPCVGVAVVHFALRVVDVAAPQDAAPGEPGSALLAIGSAEAREFFIALFLSMFLVSVYVRSRGIKRPAKPATPEPAQTAE